MRVRTLLGFALSLVLIVATPSVVANAAQPSGKAAGDKGPIGWDVYRSLDGMANMRPGAQARQFSSYDRTGQNDDGFNNTFSCLRHSDAGCVIAEDSGAGQVESMWFTRDNGSMVNNGRILVELDGKPVLDGLLQEVVDGRLGAPFEWPLVGNGDDTAGGSVIKVPMPYTQSMRITIENDPFFHHVSYREFADAEGVTTFDPADPAQDVLDRLRGFGIRDPKPANDGAKPTTQTADIAPGAAATFAEVTGSGWLTQLRMRLPQVIASPRVVNDGRAFGAGGDSTFRVAVDPANSGVRLTRRIDPTIANQVTKFFVDGQEVATQDSGPAQSETWVNQVIEVPAALTEGKSTVEVRAAFESSTLDVNEFRYDVHSKVGDTWSRTDVLDLGPGHDGEERAHAYTIRNQNWEGARVFRYPADAAELERSDAVLAEARLKITFDGQATVDAPVGEFFGSGIGEYDSRTLFSSIDASADGWYTAWWPMPYAQGAKVEVTNGSGVPITGAVVEVTSAEDPSVAEGLGEGGSLGYFNATHIRAETTPNVAWNFLDVQGSGVFYGVTHSMRGLIPSGNRRNYLEGDEKVYVDGAASPTMYGTGSEDFYESGWYFREGTTYSMPLAGNPSYELDGDGCQYDCTGAYRLMIGDAVSFSSSLSFDIEHGPLDNEPGDYSSTAYWYGRQDVSLTETDTLDAADDASRTEHAYTAEGETRGTLESTFEGKGDETPVNRGVTAATGAVSFTMALADGNAGARLLRAGDQQEAYQRANVFVDDQPVGEWLQPLGNGHSRWLEDSFELPASATAGKTSVTVRIEPVSGAPAWSAATYRALSRS